jgi:hypothetical protein
MSNVTFCNMLLAFTAISYSPTEHPSLMIPPPPLWLSATNYSIHSTIPSICKNSLLPCPPSTWVQAMPLWEGTDLPLHLLLFKETAHPQKNYSCHASHASRKTTNYATTDQPTTNRHRGDIALYRCTEPVFNTGTEVYVSILWLVTTV